MNTTVYQENGGTYKVVIPKGLAESMDLDGEEVSWTVKSSKKLELTKK